jgi:hypothetical protein
MSSKRAMQRLHGVITLGDPLASYLNEGHVSDRRASEEGGHRRSSPQKHSDCVMSDVSMSLQSDWRS